MSDAYSKVGASASKTGLHDARKRAGLPEGGEHFSDLLPDIAGDPNFVSFLHCDGAGTKSIVAYLLYRERGKAESFAGLAQDALVMNLDDVYAVGAPENIVVANLVARNARLINDDVLTVLITSYRSLVDTYSKLGIPLVLGGGETADAGDTVRTLMVDAVVAGRMKQDSVHRMSSITPGDKIVGFSSTGRASYEKSDNSGIGSNGLTLARHAVLSHATVERYPEVAAPEIDRDAAYRGPFWVTDRAQLTGEAVGDSLLSPTRTYAPLLAKLYRNFGKDVRAAFHLTGGGQTKVLRFGKGLHFIKDNLFPIPPLFQLIEKHGGVPRREMYQVFNMGHRMEVCVKAEAADAVIAAAKEFAIEARIVGSVRASEDKKNRLSLQHDGQTFDYSL